jgi:hypothetical protein
VPRSSFICLALGGFQSRTHRLQLRRADRFFALECQAVSAEGRGGRLALSASFARDSKVSQEIVPLRPLSLQPLDESIALQAEGLGLPQRFRPRGFRLVPCRCQRCKVGVAARCARERLPLRLLAAAQSPRELLAEAGELRAHQILARSRSLGLGERGLRILPNAIGGAARSLLAALPCGALLDQLRFGSP